MHRSQRLQKGLLVSVLLVVFLVLSVPTVTAQDDGSSDAASGWDGERRFTVLVMGLDRRPDESRTLLVRTDVMLLVSIDPTTERIGMLHIPRDLHMTPVGSEEFVRVNTLMLQGERAEAGTGPYYTIETLQYNLGMYIDRYVMMDFTAFVEIIDAIGGVEITTTYPIYDNAYPSMDYRFEPYFLPAGTHIMNGDEALKFARTRHNDNDFVRGIRQMMVMEAVHRKVTEGDVLGDVLTRLPNLLDVLRQNVYTDINVAEMIQLAQAATTIPQEAIATGGIDEDYNTTMLDRNGSTIYVPDRSKLAELLTEVFGEGYNQ